MKTLIFILIIFSALFSIPSFTYAEDIIYYAKIENENTCFYSNPVENNENSLFNLPSTYFVTLLRIENEDFYYAKYKDVYGYVLKREVTVMDGTPLNPYANATFRIFCPGGFGLYTKPNLVENNKLTTIPYLTENITYYGSFNGVQAVPDKSNEWYYCKYNDGTAYYGYVYSVFCDKLPKIEKNEERFNIIENPIFESPKNQPQLSNLSMIFIIIGVSIPCLIVIYLLVKPTLLRDKSLNPKVKPKKKRTGDYFEFDDSDLT